jgi:predicted hydrolase (HD superfamily)
VLASRLDDDGELLEAAAWLHDNGYAPDLSESGFHPLDGARYLRGRGCSDRMCNLVAYHSSALVACRR